MSHPTQSGYRWATVTPTDHSGVVYVFAFLSFTYTSVTILARVLIKRNMLGIDDVAMLVAQGTNMIQFALLISSLSFGLGKSFDVISNDQYLQMAQTQAAGQVAIYITLGLSKTATILIGRRVFTNDMKNSRLVCNIITGVIVLWTLVSAVLVSVGCSATSISPKTSSQVCPGIESRYLFVVTTDALTDILLSVTPAYLCRRLNMSMWLKLQVLGIFALRLPLIALSGLFFAAWKYSLHNVNPGVARTPALTFQQAQLCLSILVGTIPSLKAFIQSFDTGSGAKAGMGYTSHSGDVDGSRTAHNQPLSGEGSYHLARLTRNLRDTSGDGASASNDGIVRVNRSMSFMKARRTLTEEGVELARSSSHESDRRSLGSTQEMFIRKDIEWMVTSEAARSGSDVNIPGILRLPM